MRKALIQPRIIWLLLLIACTTSQAQDLMRQTCGVAGGSVSLTDGDRRYRVQYSLGQAGPIGLKSTSRGSALEGFIQPPLSAGYVAVGPRLEIEVFPNPFEADIQLRISPSISEKVDVRICDLTGRAVRSWQFESLSIQSLECADLPSGTYILSIQTDTDYSSTKIIKS